MLDLSGKTALVTGASGGIGSEIAKSLERGGGENSAQRYAQGGFGRGCQRPGRRNAYCGLQSGRSGKRFGPGPVVEADFAPIDIFVSNAGLTRDGLLLRMKDDDWQTVMDVNLGAYFRIAKACLKGMMKRRHGRIIGITSIVGVTGNPGQANYAASKAGMIGFTKSLAQEIASREITANCIAPGFIASPMTDALSEAQKEKLLQGIPVGRLGTGTDIASAVRYLASEEAAYITGQTLHVNGGMAMI